MSSLDDIDADTYQDNVLRIAEKIAVLLNEVIDLKYRQFTEVELEEIEEKSVALLEEYLKLCLISDILTQTRPDESEFHEQVSSPDFLFHDLFHENRKLRRILKQQKEAEELQLLKQRFYAVTNTDTCMSYMKQMDVDAQGFLKRLQADKAKTNCNDSIKELQDPIKDPQDPTTELPDLIDKITNCRSNTKKQVIIESVTGVLTLGTAVATGVVAAVRIAGRTASTASLASAPAASRVACAAKSVAAPVVADVATGTASAANVGNCVSKVADISTTAAGTVNVCNNIVKQKKNQVVIKSVNGFSYGMAAAIGVVAALRIAGRTANAAASAFAPAASIDGCSKSSHVKTDRASRTSSAANVDNSVSEVAAISTTAAKTVRTTVNVGKIVITAGSAITEAINIGTAVTNAKPHTANRNRFRHELFRTFQETYSTASPTTQSQTDTDTQTSTRTMALIVYEKLINDEMRIVEKIDCSVEA